MTDREEASKELNAAIDEVEERIGRYQFARVHVEVPIDDEWFLIWRRHQKIWGLWVCRTSKDDVCVLLTDAPARVKIAAVEQLPALVAALRAETVASTEAFIAAAKKARGFTP